MVASRWQLRLRPAAFISFCTSALRGTRAPACRHWAGDGAAGLAELSH